MVKMRFHNTLTRRVEPLEPIDPPDVTMYNCGPTVYDHGHIGNFRAFVFADLLRRAMELSGLRVHQVMNITDVGHMTEDDLADGGGEDKMAVGAQRLKEAKKKGEADVADPDDPRAVAAFFTRCFIADARRLRLKIAGEYPEHMPCASDHVTQMQDLIGRLLDNGCAYVAADGAVYFSVERFPDYGRLSGNSLGELRGGAGGRVLDEHQAQKRHPADFLLWKSDATHIMKWPSPWGEGYPGWHVECSAMAMHVLGRETIDIHTGGEDNIFPHHECEIAQSTGATGRPFARMWLHARFLLVEGEKMSKSRGNFLTVRDLVDTGVDPVAVRMELLKAPYRANANFTRRGLLDSARVVQRLRQAAADFAARAGGATVEADVDHPMVSAFASALADDLNIAAALGALFTWLGGDHPDAALSLAALRRVDAVLDVLEPGDGADAAPQLDVATACAAVDRARAERDFATADRLRADLIEAGYDVQTTKEGTTARRRLA